MRKSLVAAGCGVLWACLPAAAQQTNVDRFERQLEQIRRETRLQINRDVPAEQRALVDYGAYLGLSFFAIDDIEQNTHILRMYELVPYARLNIDNAHEFFVLGRLRYDDFNSGDSFDGKGDEADSMVEQAYYRFDLARYLGAYKGQSIDYNIVPQVGRQLVYWANGLVLGGQSLDAAKVDFTFGKVSLTMLGGMTARKTVDFDSSRPNFDDDTNRAFYGGLLSVQAGRHRPFVYVMAQRDHNDDDTLATGPITTRYRYNSYYIGAGSNGSIGDKFVYGVELVYEGGRGLSNSYQLVDGLPEPVPQTDDDIQAAAADFRLDYLVGDARRTRLSLETILATGDTNRLESSTDTFGGNRPGTNDRAFNAWGLLNTGLAFAPSVSNLITVRGGVSSFPFTGSLRRLQVGADVLGFSKFNRNAPVDEPTTDGWFLGWEPDIYLNWQITSDVTLTMRYGVFFPGDAIVNDEHPRNFFYTGLTFAF